MKASELRIGNLLHCPAIGDNYTDRTPNYGFCVFPVCQINANGTIKLDIGFGATQDVDLRTKDVEPISLTEEWLLKFGFKYQDRDVNTKTPERFYISPYFGKYREYWIEMNLYSEKIDSTFAWLHWDIGSGKRFVHLPKGHELKYVHQLQNIYLSLTGEELTITA